LDFYAKYSGIPSEIREALDGEDMERAHRLVHTLKGVAGNLAAKDLQVAAEGLERFVKHRQANNPLLQDRLNEKLIVFESALHQALTAVQILTPPGAGESSETPAEALDPELVDAARDAARGLRDAAEIGDVTEINSIGHRLKSLSETFTSYSEKITQLADDFDFDGIMQLAGDLEKAAR
jgi:HPt (histidine-containing phosphotransfer) domain-containing protein